MFKYSPIIKGKGFLPNPIAKHGIPDYADSKRNPKIKGTVAWEEWWKEQIHYMLNGYQTGGQWISGRYYKYLNFDFISTPGRGFHHPDYVDLDLERSQLIEYAKQNNMGIISLKARRKGESEQKSKMIFDYGYMFIDKYRGGIAAGLDVHSEGLFLKVQEAQSYKPPELRIRAMKKNPLIAGWEVKEFGKWETKGTQNKVRYETFHDKANKFKGEYFNDVVFEEAGEFELLLSSFDQTKACFMVGNKMIGTPFVQGTGGDISKGSAGFMEMWYHPDEFNLMKLFIPATRMYFPFVNGSTDEFGDDNSVTPNLDKLKPFEKIGCEDTEAAKADILKTREKLSKKSNKQAYYEHLRDYPLDERESFLKFSINDFDSDLLNEQADVLRTKKPAYKPYILEWEVDEKGEKVYPLKINARVAKKGEEYDIDIFLHPRPGYTNLDIAGLDSYDLDKSKTSKSLGAMTVYRREHSIDGLDYHLPIASIRTRPKRKEMFYERCLKTAVYYGLYRNVLIDVANPLIIEYFKDNGGEIYLAPRPLSAETTNSEQQHKYGMRFTTFSKPLMISKLQSYIIDHIHKCEFPWIIDELLDYDVEQRDSDWDSADATGLALILDGDISSIPREEEEVKPNDFDFLEWKSDNDGNFYNKAMNPNDQESKNEDGGLSGWDALISS